MKQTVVNEFKDGLNLDLHPIVTPNTVLTDNLNGTFITYNGNELCLQNDRGNTEICSLTDGFIPIGAKEHNGIIYIVSVKDDITEIGTYPGLDWSLNNEQVGELDYSRYTPLDNLYLDDSYETKVDGGFQFRYKYNCNTPVTIEVQDSYDGSVNLIIIGGETRPIIINSGFSVLPENKYKLIDRDQTVDTNKYCVSNLEEQIELIRISNTVTNVDLHGYGRSDGREYLLSGGQLKGGNYKFYIKFGDADFNQTDVVAESGIVSIFNGKNGMASTISGTLLDERTDKMIGLDITGLNHIYSKIYVYYSREYSDTNGYRMTEARMLNEPIDMVNDSDSQTIWITGFEQDVPINLEELNVDYHTVDFAKAETQQSNMLFLGNIGRNEETFKTYIRLKELTKDAIVKADFGKLEQTEFDGDLYTGSIYYDVANTYYKLGYYPGEMYRFGIVYVFKDGSTSPVFNIAGGEFVYDNNEFVLDRTYNNKTQGDLWNSGVIIMPEETDDFSVIKHDADTGIDYICPIYLKFTLPFTSELLDYNIKSWFVVRQKRIPNVICQGLSAKIDHKSHVPLIFDGMDWITQSFLSANRNSEFPQVTLSYDNVAFTNANNGNLTEEEYNEMYGSNSQHTNSIYVLKNSQPHVFIQNKTYNKTVRELNKVTQSDKFYEFYAFEYGGRDVLLSNLSGNNSITLYQTDYSIYVNDVRKQVRDKNRINYAVIHYWSTTSREPGNIVIDTQVTKDYNKKWNRVELSSNVFTVKRDETQNVSEDHLDWLAKYGGSVRYKKLTAKVNVTESEPNPFSSDALLSLDPCLNPTVRSMLNGNSFVIKKQYDVDVASYEDCGYYQYTPIGISDPETINAKAVFVNSDTAIKVVDNYPYSTIAGDLADASKYSYFTSPLTIEQNTDSNNRLKEDDYKHSNNINIIRGKFCPYIGVASKSFPENETAIYAIKIKEFFVEQDIDIRANDNSEYYCVSKRFTLDPDNLFEENIFGGDCFVSTTTLRIIRNFIDPTAPISENILKPESWQKEVVEKMFSSEYTGNEDEKIVDFGNINVADVNTVDLGLWVTIRTLSNYNLGLRSQDYSHVDEMSVLGSPRTFYPLNGASTATGAKVEESWLLNDGYNATVGRKRYNLLPDVPYTKSEFSNRIMFSNVNVTDAFTNGYRTFQGLSYKDYDKQYGEITKLIPWGSNIFCVMEHGIGLVAVNERALMQTTTGEEIHIYGHGVLPDQMTIISQDYGSKYPHSVIRTPIGIYGIDTDAKKVWRVRDKYGFETISDMKIETYLNDNLFTNKDSSIQTIDVRTHYNAFKGDVMFTFYNTNNPYLIIPSYIEVTEGSEYLLEIKTNQNDLIFEINNTEIAEVIMRNDKKYIKGKLEGDTILNVRNNVLNKTSNIKVKRVSPSGITPIKKYLMDIPSKITLRVNESMTCNFKGSVNVNDLMLSFNSSNINVVKSTNGLAIVGLKESDSIMTVKYGLETVNCRVIVIDDTIVPSTDPGQTVPDLPDTVVVPDEDTPVSSNTFYTVWLHRPDLNGREQYASDCSVFVTYEGVRTEYEFTSGQEVKKLSLKKGSSILIECSIEDYSTYSKTVAIVEDDQNIYISFGTRVTLTINSITPQNAKVTINNVEVGVGDYVYPWGNLIQLYASADGYLSYQTSFQMFEDRTIDVELAEGDCYLAFNISNYIYGEGGGYQTSPGAPSGTVISYEITNTGDSGSCDRDSGLYIPLHKGDSVCYEISAPGFESVGGCENNITGVVVNKYVLTPSDYYEFRVYNIPDGETFVVANGTICHTSNVLHFLAGTEVSVAMNGHSERSFIMPDSNVDLDATEFFS